MDTLCSSHRQKDKRNGGFLSAGYIYLLPLVCTTRLFVSLVSPPEMLYHDSCFSCWQIDPQAQVSALLLQTILYLVSFIRPSLFGVDPQTHVSGAHSASDDFVHVSVHLRPLRTWKRQEVAAWRYQFALPRAIFSYFFIIYSPLFFPYSDTYSTRLYVSCITVRNVGQGLRSLDSDDFVHGHSCTPIHRVDTSSTSRITVTILIVTPNMISL